LNVLTERKSSRTLRAGAICSFEEIEFITASVSCSKRPFSFFGSSEIAAAIISGLVWWAFRSESTAFCFRPSCCRRRA
jgi:hypothetical protein